MGDRVLDLKPEELASIHPKDLLESIRLSEGRTIIAEIVSHKSPLISEITNGELAAAFGADLLLMNQYDVGRPLIAGIRDSMNFKPLESQKKMAGRAIGITLEPVDWNTPVYGKREILPPGRVASAANARRAHEQGAQLVVLTGNPKTGVTNQAILHSITEIKAEMGMDLIVAAGKMHSAGSLEQGKSALATMEDLEKFILAGADIIIVPAPGTRQGATVEYVSQAADLAHKNKKLLMTAVGTSQESADVETIRTIALYCKMAGADLHHLGDGAFGGMAPPENILEYSIVIRGKRHTYKRMAMR